MDYMTYKENILEPVLYGSAGFILGYIVGLVFKNQPDYEKIVSKLHEHNLRNNKRSCISKKLNEK